MKNIIIAGAISVFAIFATIIGINVANVNSLEEVNNNAQVEEVSNNVLAEEVNSEKNVYATIYFGDGDTFINMDDVSAIYDYADLVVVGTVTKVMESTMSYLSPFPYTPVKMKVDKTIKGSANDSIEFYVAGGSVTIKEFIDGSEVTWERVDKMGLKELPETIQETQYIQYKSNLETKYEVGDTYVMLLKKCSDNNYTVIDDNGVINLRQYEPNAINTKSDVIELANSMA